MKFMMLQSASRLPQQLKLHNKNHNHYATYAIIFLTCFILSFIAGSFVIIPQGTKAVTGLNLASAPTISLTTSTNTVSMNVMPTTAGVIASASHNLVANTNVPTGYSLGLTAISASGLTPTTGTITSPTTLANNTWGYALANSAVGATNGFDASYATPVPSVTSKWADPSTVATIKNTTTSATNDSTTVYYGAKIDMSLASGTYTNTVAYTATANISTITAPSIVSITPTSGTTAGGTVIEIAGVGFTMNDQSVTTGVTLDGQACTNVSISSNTPATGQDTIYCTTPAHPTVGAVDIAVATWHSSTNAANGYTYTAPTPTITTPTIGQILNAGTTSTNLTVTTNTSAICYYGTATNPTTQMTTTGTTTHSQSITNLTNASTNTIYVRCQAATGHSYGTNTNVTFYIRTATPATPTLTPANGATVNNGTTTIKVTSTGATCTWGTSSGSYPNASGTTRTTTTGTNTLYYSCTAGTGNTQSEARTGSWSYTGQVPIAQTGDAIQTVTTATCPTTRTRVNDARDNATYWIQKLADNRCWMLTNLAYAGGGTNNYGDVKTINLNSTNTGATYTSPEYYIPPGSNRTTGTTDPSTSTNGTGQYGYLYNWCAAMGTQTSTAACAMALTPTPDTGISICPSGWRLPTSNTGGEFEQLTTAIGATNNSTGSTALRSIWLGVYSGLWDGGFGDQGSFGLFWSSTQYPSEPYVVYPLSFVSSAVYPSSLYNNKATGFAVRCLAAS